MKPGKTRHCRILRYVKKQLAQKFLQSFVKHKTKKHKDYHWRDKQTDRNNMDDYYNR